jgi:CRISPR-associated Csx14 family protein
MENMLIASLGESPIVVTAMYRLLAEQKSLEIKKVVVLYPTGGLIPLAIDLIREALQGTCEVVAELLPFDDAATEADSFTFLRTLYRLLDEAQKSEQGVYLSLAGGRKNMSALMALLVPLFSCVKGLYHVIDKDEASYRYHFKSIHEIVDLAGDDRLSYFFPDPAHLKLVEIPYSGQQVSETFRSLLFTITEEELDDLWDSDPEEAAAVEVYQRVAQDEPTEKLLKVMLTKRARDEYQRIRQRDATIAGNFAKCFKQMKDPGRLKGGIHGSGFNHGSLSFYFYKRRRTLERPFFHTEPEGIHFFPKARVETVIISGLAIEQKGGGPYKPTGEQLVQAFDPEEDRVSLEAILPLGTSADVPAVADSILVVPLGTSPMIATQLYTLLTHQGSTIREVVLVYPALAREIKNGADLLDQAFADENAGVRCLRVEVSGYADIDSKEACQAYEKTLEKAIDEARKEHPDCQVELALSGGRKGMAALAMFVAQRKGIRFVYHTLITDKILSERVERETTVSALRSTQVSKEVRNNRLFLREYDGDEPSTPFALFKVPVLPAAD